MDINVIKQKLAAQQSMSAKKEKIDYSKFYWKPKQEGKYQIRIVPSVISPQTPFQEVFIHYGISKFPIYALTNWGEKDPIVEFAKQLRSTGEKENYFLAKKLDPKMRVFAPVIVRGEEDKGVRLWEFGKEIYMQLLGIAEDEDYGDFTDIHEGRDFTIEAILGDIGGRQGLKSSIRIKPKTTPLSESKDQIKVWLTEQPNILEIQRKTSFEDLKESLMKFINPEGEETNEIVTSNEPNDLPWEKENPSVVKPKTSKSDKFTAMFDDEDEE
jgi:hypothetical protein